MTSKEALQRQAKAEAMLDTAMAEKTRLEATLKEWEGFGRTIEEAQVFIQQVAKDTQEQIRYHLEDMRKLAKVK